MMDDKVIGCAARCKWKPDCAGCGWRAEYLVRQEWIREYARSVGLGEQKFRYEQPEALRRFLRLGPCVDCELEAVCDMACPAYVRWWDMRREAWGRIGMEPQEGRGDPLALRASG